VYELVETDQVDLGLVSYPKASRTIRAIAWRDEPMVFVCSPKHKLAWRDQVPLHELDGQDLVSFDPQLQIRRELDRVLAAHDVEMRVVMEFDNIETIKRAIEIDAGVGILPEPTIDKEVKSGSLVARPLKGVALSRPVGIIVRCGKELGRIASRFIDLLQQTQKSAKSVTNGHRNGSRGHKTKR
jgi:DNA-binding transcriptional LysR family regulator